MTTQEIKTEIEEFYNTFLENHVKSSKASHGRARSALTKVKKLIGEYKRTSIAEDKK
tara:strand:- start:1512 stop:1682 length:171 start_codon:yes stop_codon:yes gene_type:complete